MKELSSTKMFVWEVFDLGILTFAIPAGAIWYTVSYAHPLVFVATLVLIFPAMTIIEDLFAKVYWTKEEYAVYKRNG